jgi:hypothetical protein
MAKFDLDIESGRKIYDDAVESAEEDLIKAGIPLPERPTDMQGALDIPPVMPPDLGELDFRGIQTLLGQFTSWYNYASGQFTKSEGERNAAEKQRAFAWSKIRKLKEGTVEDKNDQTRVDGRYMQADANYEYWDAKTRMLKGIVDGLKRNIETISRSINTLEGRVNVHGRSSAIDRRRYGGAGENNRGEVRTLNKGVLNAFRTGKRSRG